MGQLGDVSKAWSRVLARQLRPQLGISMVWRLSKLSLSQPLSASPSLLRIQIDTNWPRVERNWIGCVARNLPHEKPATTNWKMFCRHTDRYLSRDSSSTQLHTSILLALAVQQSQGHSRHKEAATKACQGSQCVAARNGRRFPQPQSTGGHWSSATLTKSSQSLYQLIATYFHEELKRPYRPFWVIQAPIVP